MAKHSPGPFYRFAKQSKCIASADGQHIATAVRYCGREQQDANANLLAASSDLLSALQEAAPADFASTWLPYPIWEQARAAIAKAEGRI